MATRIRLRRVGRKKLPLYRIVVADQESPRDGRFIEVHRHLQPEGRRPPRTRSRSTPRRRGSGSRKGATPSDTVQSLLKQAGVFKAATA